MQLIYVASEVCELPWARLVQVYSNAVLDSPGLSVQVCFSRTIIFSSLEIFNRSTDRTSQPERDTIGKSTVEKEQCYKARIFIQILFSPRSYQSK